MAKKEKAKAKEKPKQKILGPTYEPGVPSYHIKWRDKLGTRDQKMAYLKTGERYWYNKDVYGSERRKKPA